MADQPVTREKLINADIDVDNLGKAVNEETIVTPRYGDQYKSAPLAIKEIKDNGVAAVAALNAKADQVLAQGFYKGYTTEALLLAAKPAVAEMRARADDTRKIYRWNRTSAEGVTPITGTWVDTGLSDKDLAAADATTKANTAEANAKDYTDKEMQITIRSDQSNLKDQAAFAFTDSRGVRTWLEVTEDGSPTEYAITSLFKSSGALKELIGTGVDLSTWAFFGSSSMWYVQEDIFTLLQNNFDQIRTPKYYGTSASLLGHQLADIGCNDGYVSFNDGIIDNTERTVTVEDFYIGGRGAHQTVGELENGIKGILLRYTFKATDDIQVPIDPNLRLKFTSKEYEPKNAVAVVNLGKNSITPLNADKAVIEGTRRAVEYLDSFNQRHTIVIGHFVNTDQAELAKQNIINVNDWMKSLYFDRFIDVQKYLMSEQVWADVGLSKTQEDIDAIAAGVLPPSLGRDSAHLSAAVDTQLAEQVLNLVISKGWYA